MMNCVQNIVTKNFIGNGTVSCFEGRIGFPCLANKPGEFSQNIFPSASNFCRTFYLTHFVLSFPLKTTVSSDHFVAAITIRRSVFCIGRVIFCHFHIIFAEFRPVINATKNIIKLYHCMNTRSIPAFLRYKRHITAALSHTNCK